MFNKSDKDIYAELNIKKSKTINIVNLLSKRELGYYKRTETKFNEIKRFYLAIHPNFTVLNVKTPNCYLRRFSPDGRFLIAFNQLLNGIIVYKYNGCTSAQNEINSLFKTFSKNLDKSCLNNQECEQLRLRIFNLFFKEIKNLKLIQQNELINRECTLFFNDNYLIVASSEQINDDSLPPYSQLSENNESIHVSPIENYTIYLINLNACKQCDLLTFKHDKIVLTHNQGLNLYRNVFSVLSQQNQTIHIYRIIDCLNDSTKYDKQFVLLTKIGRFCFLYDSELLQNSLITQYKYENSRHHFNRSFSCTTAAAKPKTTIPQPKAFTEPFYSSLKQRLISFFYKEALQNNTLTNFYMSINAITNLKIYRVQLLDENHILIKYTTTEYIINQKPSSISSNNSTTNVNGGVSATVHHAATPSTSAAASAAVASNTSQIHSVNQSLNNSNISANIHTEQSTPFFFALYNISKAEIINVFRNNSAQLLYAYENFQDYFTLTSLDTNFTNHTLPSNNIHARQILQRNIKNITKFNNQNDMIKYLLTQLPISSQSYTLTPYLDHDLFSYDEKFISNFDRPKAIGDQVIRFNNRETGRPCFRLYPGTQQLTNVFVNNYPSNSNNEGTAAAAAAAAQNNNNNINSTINHQSILNFTNVKRLVAFIWHPREPFCISVQRGTSEYNVNFHIYKK